MHTITRIILSVRIFINYFFLMLIYIIGNIYLNMSAAYYAHATLISWFTRPTLDRGRTRTFLFTNSDFKRRINWPCFSPFFVLYEPKDVVSNTLVSKTSNFEVKSGVPQRSHLGSLLFILLMDNITQIFKLIKIHQGSNLGPLLFIILFIQIHI